MSDPAPKRRFRLPRFSLITLIGAVNVAGLLLWANVHGHILLGPEQVAKSPHYAENHVSHGWPFEHHMIFADMEGIYAGAIVANALIALALIVSASMASEFLVRKVRKAKRHDG